MSYLDTLFSVANKTIFITGAGSGLAQHCAVLFAKLGSHVVFVDINQDGLNETEEQIKPYSSNYLKLKLDVTDEQAVQNAVAAAIKTFGQIDILLNCAAVIDYVPWNQVTENEWNRNYKVDLLGSWFTCKAVAESMIAKKIPGSIINIASSLCHRTQKDLIPYNTVKAAVAHMTRSLGLELTPYNIRVNALAPGFMKTKMVEEFLKTQNGEKAVKSVPFKRAANLTEIEGVILLLASNASSYMSGSVIRIDGGLSFNEIVIPDQ
ncbi:MAG TPA: SDR family oxidoreductase [Coxiellaceae bacterium]|nr:SDR family oxidoreductase [Coxiellaceae bacterium]